MFIFCCVFASATITLIHIEIHYVKVTTAASEGPFPPGIDMQGGKFRLRMGYPQEYIGKYKSLAEVSIYYYIF